MVLESRLTVQSSDGRSNAKGIQATAARSASGPGYEGRFDELGDYTVAFEQFSDGGDTAPLFRGLPDHRCQCPHWGIVVKGRLTFSYADGQDVVEAGEAYSPRPGTLRPRTQAPRRSSSRRPPSSRHDAGRREERRGARRTP